MTEDTIVPADAEIKEEPTATDEVTSDEVTDTSV